MTAPAVPHARRLSGLLTVTLALALFGALVLASTASAQSSPWWRLDSTSAPTLLPQHGEAQIVVTATNLGDGELNATGTPLSITDELPTGVEPEEVRGIQTEWKCPAPPLPQKLTCTYTGTLQPYWPLSMDIVVRMNNPTQTPLQNVVMVSGGGAPSPEPLEKPLTLASSEGERTPFGVEREGFQLRPESETGSLDAQAGSHPFQLTTSIDLDQTLVEYQHEPGAPGVFPSAPALPNELRFKLPPGLIANATAVPQCTAVQFSTLSGELNLCPADTAVGVATALVNLPSPEPYRQSIFTVPLFNLTPAPGEPARFGFVVHEVPVVLNTALVAGGSYAAEVSTTNTSQTAQFLSSEVTVWGVPGDPRHDRSRGWQCLVAPGHICEPSGDTAFLTLPTACGTPLRASVSGSSWPTGEPGNKGTPLSPENAGFQSSYDLQCTNALEFNPSLSVEAESHSASTPTGLNVGVEMPQAGLTAPGGDAESALKATTVRLPPGLTLNPSAANALEDCSAKEFDFLNQFGNPFEGAEEEAQTENVTSPSGPSGCKDAAKVGTVKIATPLLPHELTGSVYLAAQNTSPFKSPLALYLLAEDPAEGIRVKLAGSVNIEPDGQVVSTFANTPQLPFTSLQIHLFGGERASQSTPPSCGPATTTSEFLPWSGGPSAHPESTFQITSGVGGGPCPPAPLPFSPSFRAGPASPHAGAFSPEIVDIGRPDGQQALSGISVTLPPGFAGILASVTPCPEPPAGQEWTCGAASEIGEVKEYSGLGTEPVALTGEAYLTSGYDGAPFGLLVRTHAAVGPFDLGWVNVRSRIDVNPNTAQVTVTADPGPRGEKIPTILDGVPVQLKALEVAVNRPNFTFNPTSCDPMEFTATLGGSEGAAFGASDPFKAEGCAALPFHPTLEASTQGQASKQNGASLTVKVTSQGLGVANIAKTKLTLPIALPSRLSTIQKACPDGVFESTPANPGSACDEGSEIGRGIAHTPVLKAPFEGPAYLVSHGGAEFPDVEFVLRGEGILLVLDGRTDIVKGITTSEFNAVPDQPVETFEAVLPTGPHSALGAYASGANPYDLCGANLTMPTVITAQNGAVIEQQTKINATGCGGVASYKATLVQRLAKALAKCRSAYKHSASRRAACERRAHATYTAMAVAACRKSDKHSAKKLRACEAHARKAYAARKASRR